eukprot:c6108_g1_i1.p1 GENE.c6108_g1_i1~~c6108_g1_i1.p1  ORF type:complete len:166 (+),score=18.69 c6108_g1_i1:50-499(+)
MGEYQSLTMESLQSEVLRLERLANSDLDTLRRQIAASTAPSRDVERGRSIGESLLQQSENIRMCLSRLEELQELMQERASTVLDNHKVQRHKHVLSDLHKEFSSLQVCFALRAILLFVICFCFVICLNVSVLFLRFVFPPKTTITKHDL